MTVGLQSRVLLAAVLPTFAVAALAWVGVPPVGLTAASVATGAVTALLIVWIWRPLRRLEARTALVGNSFAADPPRRWHLETAEQLFDQFEKRQLELQSQFEQTLVSLTTALAELASDLRTVPQLAPLSSPWPSHMTKLTSAFAACGKAAGLAHRRATTFHTLLFDVPQALIVCDSQLRLTFANRAAEELFPTGVNGKRLRTITDLFVPAKHMPAQPQEAAPMLSEQAVASWLASGQGGSREAWSMGPAGRMNPVELSALSHADRAAGGYVTLAVRDLSATRIAEGAAHTRQRQQVGQRLCRLVADQVGPALNVVRSQAALLTQAAKQTGQREKFLPGVQCIVQEVDREALMVQQLGWLGRLHHGFASEPQLQEVRLGALAADVADRLQAAFAERGNTLETTDDAGWLLADEEWLTALVTGLLLHANQRTEHAAIQLRLCRRSVVQASDERAEILVRFAAPPLASPLVDDVRDPYRRPDSAVFTAGESFLLGLAVAHRVAGLLFGELQFAAADGMTEIRVMLPTRITRQLPAEQSKILALAVAEDPMDELHAWRIGGVESAADVATMADNAATLSDVQLEVVDDSVGAWFGP